MTVAPGSTGNRVKEIQCLLDWWGDFSTSQPMDGVYGPYTKTAVTNFQRRWGLTPDGVVGQGTWWCLRAATCG